MRALPRPFCHNHQEPEPLKEVPLLAAELVLTSESWSMNQVPRDSNIA